MTSIPGNMQVPEATVGSHLWLSELVKIAK